MLGISDLLGAVEPGRLYVPHGWVPEMITTVEPRGTSEPSAGSVPTKPHRSASGAVYSIRTVTQAFPPHCFITAPLTSAVASASVISLW